VPVHDGDDEASLHERIKREEHRLLPAAVRLVALGRVSLDGRRARLRFEPGSLVPDREPTHGGSP
jgi:phosphoribosylglycinamide formyltransferase-1